MKSGFIWSAEKSRREPDAGPPAMQLYNAAVILRSQSGRGWLCFLRPHEILVARHPHEVIPALETLERKVRATGLHAAGFIAYEAAPAFDPCLSVRPAGGFPLLWFGLFDRPAELDRLPPCSSPGLGRLDWKAEISARRYGSAITRIKKHIGCGDTYQVNFTYRLRAACPEDPLQLFLEIAEADAPPCSAFIDTGRWAVCSASPELFFELRGRGIESRPMKGTAGRGLWPAQDRQRAGKLAASAKDRAENLMIADMVRNDLGRIAEIGSVRAPRLFTVEQYPTVWQMTSTVRASTRAGMADIFKALFPPASITGAPKFRTMRIISALESSPRKIYTGAIGYIAPGRRARFSVAIRTLLIDRQNHRAEYGVGGGIVWDSRTGSELEESRVKSRIIRGHAAGGFDLLETMLWTPWLGCWLLPYHLRRVMASAEYFGFKAHGPEIRRNIDAFTARLSSLPHRIRMLVARGGGVSLSAEPLQPCQSIFGPVSPAARPIEAANPLHYHKTTCRSAYDRALEAGAAPVDALLYNGRGEITETTIANIAFDIGGVLYTPPVSCGLLPGTLRACLLDRGCLREKAVTLEQLGSCRRLFLFNSVRGMQRVKINN